MFLKHLANKAKDAALQGVAAWFANKYHLKKLGQMTKLQIDSEKNEVSLTLDLHGEQSPIDLTIRYRVIGATEIEIVDVRSSREWIATLVNEVIPATQKQITVPVNVTKALSKLFR